MSKLEKTYPKSFRNGTWERLIPADTQPELDISDVELERTFSCLKQNETRIGRTFYSLDAVQAILNYAIRAKTTVNEMKRKAIEVGAAKYNSKTGEFEWNC